MSGSIVSVKNETKKELSEKQLYDVKNCRFNIEDIFDKPYSGNGELWSIWYNKLYGDFFNAVDDSFMCPIETEDVDTDDVFDNIENGFNNLIKRISSTDDEAIP